MWPTPRRPTTTPLGDTIRAAGAGHVVHLKVYRDGKTIDVDATLSTHLA